MVVANLKLVTNFDVWQIKSEAKSAKSCSTTTAPRSIVKRCLCSLENARKCKHCINYDHKVHLVPFTLWHMRIPVPPEHSDIERTSTGTTLSMMEQVKTKNHLGSWHESRVSNVSIVDSIWWNILTLLAGLAIWFAHLLTSWICICICFVFLLMTGRSCGWHAFSSPHMMIFV